MSLFFSCVSSPKEIKFNELSSKTFMLNNVNYATLFDEFTNKVPELFAQLPIQQIINLIESQYGVNIDNSLFSNSEINALQIKSYDLSIRNYFIEYETNESQRVVITFSRIKQDQLLVDGSLRIYEEDEIVSMTSFMFIIDLL
jgi:hypothetical protein